MMSANKDAINRYNANMAAFDQIFKQNKNATIAINPATIILLFFDKLESLREYLILKNAYSPIMIPNIIPIIKYSSK